MRNIVFEPKAFQDFNNWVKEDKKIYGALLGLRGKLYICDTVFAGVARL